MKARDNARVREMRAEYVLDYSKAVRGKYYRRLLSEGANVVVLDPDVARIFRTSAQVNDALRRLLPSSTRARSLTARNRPKARTRRASPRDS